MGTLFLVGTPIGNLEDITVRALRVLEEVSLIAAEDTRRTRVLLDQHSIATPMISYFEQNKLARTGAILDALGRGDVAVVSDAGMPGLSDPGFELVRAAIEHGYKVVPVPGPSASITALVVSGLPTDQFRYLGFLPRRSGKRQEALRKVASERCTLVAFETPQRLPSALADLETVLGDRQIALCRELTKKFEEVWRGTISEARSRCAQNIPRGEYTLVIAGASDRDQWDKDQVAEALSDLLARGASRSQAVREVADLSGWNRRRVYRLALNEEKDD